MLFIMLKGHLQVDNLEKKFKNLVMHYSFHSINSSNLKNDKKINNHLIGLLLQNS